MPGEEAVAVDAFLSMYNARRQARVWSDTQPLAAKWSDNAQLCTSSLFKLLLQPKLERSNPAARMLVPVWTITGVCRPSTLPTSTPAAVEPLYASCYAGVPKRFMTRKAMTGMALTSMAITSKHYTILCTCLLTCFVVDTG